jgi:hypothetical protein
MPGGDRYQARARIVKRARAGGWSEKIKTAGRGFPGPPALLLVIGLALGWVLRGFLGR